MSEAFRALRKLARIKFTIRHRGNENDKSIYTAMDYSFLKQPGGGNAKNVKFDWTMPNGAVQNISVFDYFRQRYNIILRHWRFPLIRTNKNTFFPMELCQVERFNRYPYKLNPNETSEMIKFAVQRPKQRLNEIMENVRSLNWKDDRYLQQFGISVNPSMPKVPAKVIKNPEIQFGNGKVNPGVSGRWDIRGRKFLVPNPTPLRSWAFVVLDNCIDEKTLNHFVGEFTRIFKGHGGQIDKPPSTFIYDTNKREDDVIYDTYQATGRANKLTPQIMFIVMPEKVAWRYERLKKNADCRLAILTQMLLGQHVRRCQDQYISNVCLKVNAKLGGKTCRVSNGGKPGSPFFNVPTMMIGVDVSHGPPGSGAPSMASMAISMDQDAAVYHVACQTNSFNTEILGETNIAGLLPEYLKAWTVKMKCSPRHVFYLRDGVSEGQFTHVMEREFTVLKETFRKTLGVVPKFTVIVATKRHHIRFFPQKGDNNGNSLPGLLVEREVTHPFHYDFFLNSHVAIQGTARPVHYHVIHDEIAMKVDDLQRMLYQQCYQFARSTTPVSLHPAIYYAHLASARARAHENINTSQQVPEKLKAAALKLGPMAKFNEDSASTFRHQQTEALPLLALGGSEAREDAKLFFRNTMWFI
jgi:eukaryotic translation initiation factor 2C